ncbi:MAG: galactitol-1-phosphate 5-dehydrogenase, partial [Lachnospiraceae bacterium]|nr:galactitol-1-phosphate 5-dehydrogenase [Lachnospiraceae bacterium]
MGSRMSFSPPFPGPDWTLTGEYFAKGLLKCDPSMIDREFPLSEANAAFDLFRTPGQVKGKVLLLNPYYFKI